MGPLRAVWLLPLAAALRSELQRVNDLMDVAEAVHRAFTNRYDQHLARLTVSEGRLCAQKTHVSVISRQFLEDSWSTVESASGDVEAMFNAQEGCFMKYAGRCQTYSSCADPLQSFQATAVLRQGLDWAGNHSEVKARQQEELALWDLLQTATGELAEKIREDLAAAAGLADLALSQLRSILEERVTRFSELVAPASALPPQGGSAALPASLLSLATGISQLLAAAPQTSPCSGTWISGPAQDVILELNSQDGVVALIGADHVLQLGNFDYIRRALEALLSGASLALQVAAFASLAEFNCLMAVSPTTTLVADIGSVQDAVNGVLVKLVVALPTAEVPLRRCLAERLQDAEQRLPQASSPLVVTIVPLLSLDFCGRLFNVTRELLSVVPYAGELLFTSPTELFAQSGEQRQVFLDSDKSLSLVGPFASYTPRTTSDTVAFTGNDQVLQLQHVTEMTLRGAKAVPQENQCSDEQKMALTMSQAGQVCTYAGCGGSCQPGCYRRFSCEFGICEPTIPGFWGDGETEQVCDAATGNHYFFAFKWPNSSCDFLCQEVDHYPVGRSCQTQVGYWSPVCNNTWAACDLPSGISASQFLTVANFTTAGRGAADGCEVTLAFAAAKPPAQSIAAALLSPPFTLETFVNMTLDAIPTGASSVSSMAVLFGSFPSWYLALRRVSAGQAQLVFYHSRITLASHISAEDSTVASNSFSWDNAREPWRHVAVKVTPNVAFQHNVFFYVDGVLISSSYRSVSGTDILEAPFIIPEHRDVFHVGPVNLKRFPELLTSGRPYYDLSMYAAQLDEVRVHPEALDTLTLGSQITELRRLAACNTPYEQRDGSACHARPRLTPPNTTLGQTECRAGYELCHRMPGICMEACTGNLLRQPDCSCDCAPSYFQTWLLGAVHLTGSGDIKNATVYNAAHEILVQLGHATLPQRLPLTQASQVAVVSVWGGSSASSVSLEVETPAPDSLRLVVPELRNVALQADRPSLLHHRRALDYDDPSGSCAKCPGEAPRSVLPRRDAMSCRCASGYGANLLGKCVPAGGPLQAPIISPGNGTYHTAGTRVHMSFPPQDVEGPWLLAIRYEYGLFPNAPNCDTSSVYEESGLDIIRRQEMVTVRAVLCHPMHQISLESVAILFGNDHMNPPRCVATGNMSTDSAYALEVQVQLLVDQQPDASIFYEIEGSGGQLSYATPLMLSGPGVVTLSSWAEKLGFDPSSRTSCSFSIDGAARLTLSATWPEPSPLLGYAAQEAAFLVQRDLETLAFLLEVLEPNDATQLQLEYRLWRGPLLEDWQVVPSGGAMLLNLAEQLEAPDKTTLLQVDWRLKEPGYVWTTPGSVRVLIVKTRTEVPRIEAAPLVQWELGDHWAPGAKREVAMRQTHTVQLLQPNSAARVLFSVRAEVGQTEGSGGPLLTMSSQNFTSLSSGGFVEHFRSSVPSAALQPEEMPSACGGQTALLGVDVPKLCDYLGPFQVLGGAVVTAYAIISGELESIAASYLVPKELEVSTDDLAFQAYAEVSGNVLTINEGLQVLPSASTSLTFSVGQVDAERQSCVLITSYSYKGAAAIKTMDDCQWLPYNGPRKLYLENLVQEAGITETLNVTVLTTVRRPGFLWSYPLAKSFLWLRERTPLPKVVQILEPGSVTSKSMVWLQEGELAECFFTLHYEPLEEKDVPSPFLVEVPSLTASVASPKEAFRPTGRRATLYLMDAWSADVELCAWPNACELPMNGTLPVRLVDVPAGYTRLCAWALWQGYLESQPACELTGGPTVVAEPSFVPDEPMENVVIPEEAGHDLSLRLQLLSLPGADSPGRRLSGTSIPLILPRTHPLQYRHAVAAVDVKLLTQPGMTQITLVGTMQFSEWTDLGLASATPLLSLPQRQLIDHVLLVVDVRLLAGVNRWSAETRTAALLLTGKELAPSLVQSGRSVLVEPRANSTVYFQWGAVPSFDLIQVQAGATSVANAFGVHQEAVLDSESGCISSNTSNRFCSSVGAASLAIPSQERWSLWAMAVSDGLGGSAATLMVERPCPAPQDVAYASATSCREGTLVESSASCSTACQQGYVASVDLLQCLAGELSPRHFACAEEACAAPNVSHASSACQEGSTVAPGGVCTAQCEDGFTASAAVLSCSRGRLTPSSFTCSEASCEAPDVIYAASPSCSGLARVKSGETCTPQCQDGYVANQAFLHCSRGQLDPPDFACEPGVTVDVGIIIASVPSTLLAGALALVAAYCIRSTPKEEEKPANDPLQEWWQCVKEVEPGICVFCGKEPEDMETRYEDHGPATLFRSCSSCAALLGFEEEEPEELEVNVDEHDEREENETQRQDTTSGGSQEDRNTLPRPPALTEVRSSSGSISDAVKGLQLENFLRSSQADEPQDEPQDEPKDEPKDVPKELPHEPQQPAPPEPVETKIETREMSARMPEDSDRSRRSPRDVPRARARHERMSLAEWLDSPDERLDEREGRRKASRREGKTRHERESRRTRQERREESSQESPKEDMQRPLSRRYVEEPRRSRRDVVATQDFPRRSRAPREETRGGRQRTYSNM